MPRQIERPSPKPPKVEGSAETLAALRLRRSSEPASSMTPGFSTRIRQRFAASCGLSSVRRTSAGSSSESFIDFIADAPLRTRLRKRISSSSGRPVVQASRTAEEKTTFVRSALRSSARKALIARSMIGMRSHAASGSSSFFAYARTLETCRRCGSLHSQCA